ncbi:MAG: hypothetical protein ACREGJ_04655 [Candidatus Saccharimonadales bacterium]
MIDLEPYLPDYCDRECGIQVRVKGSPDRNLQGLIAGIALAEKALIERQDANPEQIEGALGYKRACEFKLRLKLGAMCCNAPQKEDQGSNTLQTEL